MPTGTACPGATAGTKTDKRQRATDALITKTTDYCDDSSGRLTSAVTSEGPTYAYGYDKDSNRVTDAAGTHTFNAGDQLTDTGTTYNGIGQTTAVTPTGQSLVPFTYAGAGQAERTSAGTTTAQNGIGVQTETTGGATTTYVNGPGGKLVERTPGGDFYFYYDGPGSVIGLVDATTGNQRAAYTYDPYGSNATATGVNGAPPANPWRWGGGYLDGGTGLYHFGARYYDPVMGRFTQVDPVTGGSCNGYDYACGDPVNEFELSGLAMERAPQLDELCGFGSGYHPDAISSDQCVRYRNAVAADNSDLLTRTFTDSGKPNAFLTTTAAGLKSGARYTGHAAARVGRHELQGVQCRRAFCGRRCRSGWTRGQRGRGGRYMPVHCWWQDGDLAHG